MFILKWVTEGEESCDPPVGVGRELGGVEFDALAVLLYGLLVLSFLHQNVAFFLQSLCFLCVFVTGN